VGSDVFATCRQGVAPLGLEIIWGLPTLLGSRLRRYAFRVG